MASTRFPEYRPEPLPEGEAAAIRETVDNAKHFLAAGKDNVFRRGQHAKNVGCVRARFVVDADVIPEARAGVFREPREFDAIVRFSNGSQEVQKDSKGDGRGMAIKLLDVDGERVDLGGEEGDRAQDFVMINHPVFAFPNADEYARFFRQRRSAGLTPAKLLLLLTRPALAKLGKTIAANPVDSPLHIQYFSMSPYRLGTRAIKFSARPRAENLLPAMLETPDGDAPPDFLFDRLRRHLADRDASFDFLVQFQEFPERMPVEDATALWNTPFYPVGVVHIPRQDLGSDDLRAFQAECERKSFNPWHALAEHEPLGGINRLRKEVYHAISRLRNEKNGVRA